MVSSEGEAPNTPQQTNEPSVVSECKGEKGVSWSKGAKAGKRKERLLQHKGLAVT